MTQLIKRTKLTKTDVHSRHCEITHAVIMVIVYLPVTVLSPVHTSDADEPPTVGDTNIHAYEYLTGSYSGVCRRRFHADEYLASRRQYSPSSI